MSFSLSCNYLPQRIGQGCLRITPNFHKPQLYCPYTRDLYKLQVASPLGCERNFEVPLSKEQVSLEYCLPRKYCCHKQSVKRQNNKKMYYIEKKNYTSKIWVLKTKKNKASKLSKPSHMVTLAPLRDQPISA